jgi:YHS domain-containing protein
VLRPLHGGQLTIMSPLAFEVVYLPQEIQVYLYGPSQQPESAKDVKGEIALLVRGDNRVLRVPLRYVAPPANAGEPDYLAAAVGVSRLKDGEATATIKLENLPLPHHPAATFAQNVVLSKARLQVTLAAFGPGDQAGVTRQQVCPVTGAKLGSMGTPVKVLIGGQPLYLCCKGCLGKVQSAPDAYLRKAGQASQVQ